MTMPDLGRSALVLSELQKQELAALAAIDFQNVLYLKCLWNNRGQLSFS